MSICAGRLSPVFVSSKVESGRELAVAQVLLGVGLAHALGERRLVRPLGPDVAALLGDDDGGAGVLAHRQHAARGDVGVLQEVVGDELVVAGRLGVVEDFCELGEMAGPQEVVDVDHRLLGETASAPTVRRPGFRARAPSRPARPPRSACGRGSCPARVETGNDAPRPWDRSVRPEFEPSFAADGSGGRAAQRRDGVGDGERAAPPCRRAAVRPSCR